MTLTGHNVRGMIPVEMAEFAASVPNLALGEVLGQALAAVPKARAAIADAARQETEKRVAAGLSDVSSRGGLNALQLGYAHRGSEGPRVAVDGFASGPARAMWQRCGAGDRDTDKLRLVGHAEETQPWVDSWSVPEKLQWFHVTLIAKHKKLLVDAEMQHGPWIRSHSYVIVPKWARHVNYAASAIWLATMYHLASPLEAWVYLLIALEHLSFSIPYSLDTHNEFGELRDKLKGLIQELTPEITTENWPTLYQFGQRLLMEEILVTHTYKSPALDTRLIPDVCPTLADNSPLFQKESFKSYSERDRKLKAFVQGFFNLGPHPTVEARHRVLTQLEAITSSVFHPPSYPVFFGPLLSFGIEATEAVNGQYDEQLVHIQSLIGELPEEIARRAKKRGNAEKDLGSLRLYLNEGRISYAIETLKNLKSRVQKTDPGGYLYSTLYAAIDDLVSTLQRVRLP